LEQKLRVMPTWVRQQLEDAAGLLSAASERSKTEFRRLGVSFVLHMAQDGAGLPFLRAEGTTDFARVLSSGPLSTTDALHPGSAPETAPARPV
jgi:hypothetical protein